MNLVLAMRFRTINVSWSTFLDHKNHRQHSCGNIIFISKYSFNKLSLFSNTSTTFRAGCRSTRSRETRKKNTLLFRLRMHFVIAFDAARHPASRATVSTYFQPAPPRHFVTYCFADDIYSVLILLFSKYSRFILRNRCHITYIVLLYTLVIIILSIKMFSLTFRKKVIIQCIG